MDFQHKLAQASELQAEHALLPDEHEAAAVEGAVHGRGEEEAGGPAGQPTLRHTSNTAI